MSINGSALFKSNSSLHSQIGNKESSTKRDPDILIIGDGNFSFTETFLQRRLSGIGLDSKKKHPNFGSRIITTEYKSENDCLSKERVCARVNSLKKHGVTFQYNVDATTIDEVFNGRTFKRIQWNCPDINQPFCNYPPNLENTLRSFAYAAATLQNNGGKLHLTLIAPEVTPDYRTWQAFHYGVVEAMEKTGYVLHAVKDSTGRYVFNDEIFYSHQKTNGEEEVEAVNEGLNEFIFRRTLDAEEQTPSEFIQKMKGFYKEFNNNRTSYKRIKGNEPYYSMNLRSPLSSDSDCEQTLEIDSLSLDCDLFDDTFDETQNNQGGFSWADVAAGKKN